MLLSSYESCVMRHIWQQLKTTPLCVQYEDATDNVQSIREKLELERAAKCAWLREAAASCAQSSAAANGSAHVNGHAETDDDSGSIALSLAYTQRAQRDLRVSKQQV